MECEESCAAYSKAISSQIALQKGLMTTWIILFLFPFQHRTVSLSAQNRRKGRVVLPRSLHKTYTDNQREWLMDISEFAVLVSERQKMGKV